MVPVEPIEPVAVQPRVALRATVRQELERLTGEASLPREQAIVDEVAAVVLQIAREYVARLMAVEPTAAADVRDRLLRRYAGLAEAPEEALKPQSADALIEDGAQRLARLLVSAVSCGVAACQGYLKRHGIETTRQEVAERLTWMIIDEVEEETARAPAVVEARLERMREHGELPLGALVAVLGQYGVNAQAYGGVDAEQFHGSVAERQLEVAADGIAYVLGGQSPSGTVPVVAEGHVVVATGQWRGAAGRGVVVEEADGSTLPAICSTPRSTGSSRRPAARSS